MLDHEAKIAKTHNKVGCMDIVRDGEMRWSLVLALFFMFSVQFSGASSSKIYFFFLILIFYFLVAAFSKRIFETAQLKTTGLIKFFNFKINFNYLDAQLASCGISLLNIFMLVASAILVSFY